MANKSVQKIKRENVAKLIAWYHTARDGDIAEHVRGSQLNRRKLSRTLDITTSTFGSNKRLKKALRGIEKRLHASGRIGVQNASKATRGASVSSGEVERLEKENLDLSYKLEQTSQRLKQYRLFEQFLEKTGKFPRP